MKKNNEQTIEKIYSDRKLMLEMVKNGLENGNESVCNNIEHISQLLEADEKNTKEYMTILEAKDIINGLIIEINNCQSVEEIVKIRKKLNYYINKIKKLLAKRGMNDEEIANYQNNTSYLRKGISKYISFLKRENKITEINNLYDLGDNITKDELIKLRSLIKNESKYNNRFLKEGITVNKKEKKEDILADFIKKEQELMKKNNNKVVETEFFFDDEPAKEKEENNFEFIFDKEDKKGTEIDDNFVFTADEKSNKENIGKNDDASFEFIFEDDKEKNDDMPITLDEHKMGIKEDGTFDPGKFIDDFKKRIKDGCERISREEAIKEEKMKKNFNFYDMHYNLTDVREYNDSVASNLITFCANLPKYAVNKRAIKNMQKDYSYYYHVDTLGNYIQYSEKRNSIKRAFKQIFDQTFLSSHENECLNNHEKCLEWITKYSNQNALKQTRHI